MSGSAEPRPAPAGRWARRLRWLLAALLAAVLPWTEAGAEMALGVSGGATLAGDQDLKVKRFDAASGLSSVEESRGRGAATGPALGIGLVAWFGDRGPVGVELAALGWTTRATTARDAEGARLTVTQDRLAVLASAVGRLRLGDGAAPFVYGGVGGGLAWTRLHPGDDDLGPALSALAGFAFPLTDRLRLRVEARYLITSDVDATPGPGRRPETSGRGGANLGRLLFGPHLDTQFVPLLIGVDWLF